ncbi:MAG: acetylglutamate kinase [Euryarchaeota archaeon]|nr:acetylglutamate kinase [Euryarchaeota archaeon]MDE1835305.1 acetylglutamate kinase [Euryarchaeota archaeon]MDE1880576.1 acetylglutamate kinase [Euryarchaeota archaeon]MDE2043601.1 acetylglutamate kinase [Thermoplasmata archaeon]
MRLAKAVGPLTGVPRVVKVGGREVRPGPALDQLVRWVVAEARRSGPLVLVHGGGEEVSELSARLHLPVEKVDGQRVTPPEVLPLVEGVLAGTVNLRLVSALNEAGLRAVGLSGVSADLLLARDVQEGRLGAVGEPARVDPTLLLALFQLGSVPVLAPLASDGKGGVLNVNADLFAAGIAGAVGGDLLLVTDVPGVRGTDGAPIERLTPSKARALIENGTVHGGMIPKLEGALRMLSEGARGVWIGTLDLVPSEGTPRGGTWVVPEPRQAPPRSSAATSLPLLPIPAGPGAV